MAYEIPKMHSSRLKGIDLLEGEPIENKIERITANNEPITDGAPEIFTERKQGVVSAYNIRTDRWEVAADAMDYIQGSIAAKREAKQKSKDETKEAKEAKIVKMDSGAESTNGTND